MFLIQKHITSEKFNIGVKRSLVLAMVEDTSKHNRKFNKLLTPLENVKYI